MAHSPLSFRDEVRNAAIFQWNARGLRSRIADVRRFVYANKFPIIVICEPNLSSAIRLSGYEPFMSSAITERSKVLVFIRRDLTYILQPVPPHDDSQYVCVRVKKKRLTITVVGAYLSPSSRFDHKSLRDILSSAPDPCVLIGDFNAHHTLWGSLKTDVKGRNLVSFASDNELLLLNDGSPTFLRGSTYSSCLDLAFVSRSLMRHAGWFTDIETHGSDHIPTYVKIRGLSPSKIRDTIRRVDWTKFESRMEDLCQDHTLDLEEAIKSTVQDSVRTFTCTSKFTDIDLELERLRAIRRRAERRYRRTKAIDDLRTARRMQKKIQRRLDKLEFQRWTAFCESLDPRKPLSQLWRTVRGLRSSPVQKSPFKALGLYQKRPDIDVAEEFCARLSGQLTAPDSLPLSNSCPPPRDPRMDLPFSIQELKAALASCKRSSAPGPDGISYRALCHLGERARIALLELYNESWQEGTLPLSWKTSRLVPLLKPGKSPLELASYRPIALASCVGKVMERMILGRLEWYMEYNNIYPDTMAGFRRGRSSIDSVIDLITFVEHEKGRKRLCASLFLDVKGAYDNVTHEAVLAALEDVGVGGRMFKWIRSYLCMRSFFVITEDGHTSLHYSSRGVPQGGVLSPVLFNLTLIALQAHLPSTVCLSTYADDICVWTSAVTRLQLRARIQRAATQIALYLRDRGLEISPGKCALLAFTRKPMTNYSVAINGQSVPYCRSHKFLGVIIDREISWSPHVSYLKKRLTGICHLFKFFAGKTWGMSPSAMLQLYRVLFLGFLRYSLPALTNANKTSRRMLQSVQAQTLRICLGLPQSASTAATIAIAKDHLIKTHIEVEALRTHIRHLARTPNHHLASLPADRPRTSFCRTVTTHGESLPTGFTPAARPSVPPWCLKQPIINLTIPGVQKKQDLSAPALKQLALLLLYEKYQDSTHVYTDGSVLPNSSTAAVVIPTIATTIKFRTAHLTTSTAAELTALRAALLFINDQMRKRWTIFCDSKAALQSLLSTLRRGPHEQLVFETAEMFHHLTEKGHRITFQWLPSHCGIIGNERADQAARSAHTEDRNLSIPLSRTDAARKLRMLARQCTMSNWNEPHFMHARLHSFDPTLSLRLPSRLRRGDATVLCRLWLGVAFTHAYAFRIGMADTTACEHCGDEETIRHVLCDCPEYSTQRQSLCHAFNKLDDQPLSEERLLRHRPDIASQKKALQALLAFLRSTGLSERL